MLSCSSFRACHLLAVAILTLTELAAGQVPIRGPYSVCLLGVGDVDLDGVPDYYGDLLSGGTGRMYSGRTGTKLFTSNYWCYGNNGLDIGDVDGDGTQDLMGGSPYYAQTPWSPITGAVLIYSGKTGALIRLQQGANAGDEFGFSVCFVGDVNNDKCDDYAVSIARGGNSGKPETIIYSGKTGKEVGRAGVTVTDPINHLRFLGDVNNDGKADFVATSFWKVYIFSMSSLAPLRAIQQSVPDLGPVDAGMDVDGDGSPDFVFGSDGAAGGAGKVWVYSAKEGRLLHEFTGTVKEHLGTAAVLIEDLNGDGCADVLVGARNSGSARIGAVKGYSGRTGELMFTLFEPYGKYVLGTGVSVIGDINGDNLPEVAIPREDGVYIYDLQWGGAYGQGCGRATNPPRLRVDLPPRIGGTFRVEATNLLTATSGALIVGASDKFWGSTPLPLDLGVMGMIGCQLLCSFDVLLPFATITGKATISLAVPNNNALLGLTVFDQLWAVDANANTTGIATTNGVRSRVRM